MSWTPPILRSPRLILRPLVMEDAPHIFLYASRPEVARYTLWQPHRSVSDTESFIRHYAFKNYERQLCEPLGIAFLAQPEQIIGTCGAWWSSEPSSVMEMGYVLSNDHWNLGIMTEAVSAVIDHCFSHYPVNRIQAHFKIENLGSGRVMQKVGMKLEGTMRQRVFHQGRFWDTVHYAILKSEWKV